MEKKKKKKKKKDKKKKKSTQKKISEIFLKHGLEQKDKQQIFRGKYYDFTIHLYVPH